MPGVPAFVQNGRLDILAANTLAQALYADAFEQRPGPAVGVATPDGARFTFLDDRAVELYADWDKAAADTVAALRAEAGRNPTDRRLNELLGELSHSERFSTLWVSHDVRWHTSGTKRFSHRVVGELTLAWEGTRAARRPRASPHRLHRRARLDLRRGTRLPRQLGVLTAVAHPCVAGHPAPLVARRPGAQPTPARRRVPDRALIGAARTRVVRPGDVGLHEQRHGGVHRAPAGSVRVSRAWWCR